MPNICENTIQINGTKENFDKFLEDTKDMGYEGRFNIGEEEDAPTINILKAKPMPEEFNLISTGSCDIDGTRVDLWWYRSKITGEIEKNDIFSNENRNPKMWYNKWKFPQGAWRLSWHVHITL